MPIWAELYSVVGSASDFSSRGREFEFQSGH